MLRCNPTRRQPRQLPWAALAASYRMCGGPKTPTPPRSLSTLSATATYFGPRPAPSSGRQALACDTQAARGASADSV